MSARPITHWKRAKPQGFPRLRSWMTLAQWFREAEWFLETVTMKNERDSTAPRGRKGGDNADK